MRTEIIQLKLAKNQAINAVKSTIDYERLEMRESMIINSHIESIINNLIRNFPDRILTGIGLILNT